MNLIKLENSMRHKKLCRIRPLKRAKVNLIMDLSRAVKFHIITMKLELFS